MRRLLIGLVSAAAAVGALTAGAPAVSASTPPADDAAPTDTVDTAPVDLLQVSGLFDHLVVDEIHAAIARAHADGSQALILQVDSRGSVVSEADLADLFDAVANSEVAVGVWVGPTGARLYGAPAQILAVADVSGMAPGARVGNVGLPVGDLELSDALVALRSRTVGLSEARELGVFQQRISDEGIATISNMLYALDGYEHDGTMLDTTIDVVSDSGTVQRQTVAAARFSKLGLADQLFHTVASPEVAYLLLLIGLALLIFEFFTAGVGVAAVVGAVCTFLAAFGIAELPARPWAVAVIGLAMIAFAVDVQVGIPRFWTGVGIVGVVVGSWWLFESVGGTSLRPSWISLIAGIGGTVLTFVVGMPSMTRTRFATPTVGREWMIGSHGTAVTAIDPDGVVRVGDAEWRARTNRATALAAGDELVVAAIDGVTLQVEPLEGAARDYRR